MRKALPIVAIAALGAIVLATRAVRIAGAAPRSEVVQPPGRAPFDVAIDDNMQQMMDEGRRTFRFDTFGDEAFWSDGLGLDRAIGGAKHGGVGDGVSPKTALALGLKVDMGALPAALARARGGFATPQT